MKGLSCKVEVLYVFQMVAFERREGVLIGRQKVLTLGRESTSHTHTLQLGLGRINGNRRERSAHAPRGTVLMTLDRARLQDCTNHVAVCPSVYMLSTRSHVLIGASHAIRTALQPHGLW